VAITRPVSTGVEAEVEPGASCCGLVLVGGPERGRDGEGAAEVETVSLGGPEFVVVDVPIDICAREWMR
jgi:hypothetical protein